MCSTLTIYITYQSTINESCESTVVSETFKCEVEACMSIYVIYSMVIVFYLSLFCTFY